jgi:hypothetical protein
VEFVVFQFERSEQKETENVISYLALLVVVECLYRRNHFGSMRGGPSFFFSLFFCPCLLFVLNVCFSVSAPPKKEPTPYKMLSCMIFAHDEKKVRHERDRS